MANKRITELVDIGTPNPLDVLEIVDVSDTTDSPEGTSKKVKVSELGGGGGAVDSVNGQTGVISIDLQSVTDVSAITTNDIDANSFVSYAGVPSQFATFNNLGFTILNLIDFSLNSSFERDKITHNFIDYPLPTGVSSPIATLADISGGGATNLGYTASPTNGIVTSDTGTDATIPLADVTNAGLLSPSFWSVLNTFATSVRSTILTGLSTATTTAILATDTILEAFGKLQGRLNMQTLPLISDGSVTAITGVNAPTIMYSFEIPANLLNDYNRLIAQIQVTKSSGVGTSSITYHINSTNSLSGAVQIAISNMTSSIQFASLDRKFKVDGTDLSGYPFAASAATDSQNSSSTRGTTPYDTTTSKWFIIAVNPNSVAESHFLESIEINARRRKTTI